MTPAPHTLWSKWVWTGLALIAGLVCLWGVYAYIFGVSLGKGAVSGLPMDHPVREFAEAIELQGAQYEGRSLSRGREYYLCGTLDANAVHRLIDAESDPDGLNVISNEWRVYLAPDAMQRGWLRAERFRGVCGGAPEWTGEERVFYLSRDMIGAFVAVQGDAGPAWVRVIQSLRDD